MSIDAKFLKMSEEEFTKKCSETIELENSNKKAAPSPKNI